MFVTNEELRSLAAERNAAEVRLTLATATWLRGRAWELDGARSPVSWLRWRCGLDNADGRRVVRRARLVDQLAETAAAIESGALPIAHVDALGRVVADDGWELARRDAELLVSTAKELDLVAYRRFLAHWSALADDELARADAVRVHERRYLHLSTTLLGEYVLDARLRRRPPLTGPASGRRVGVAGRQRRPRVPTDDDAPLARDAVRRLRCDAAV